MKLCISQATTLPAAFADDLAAFADVGWPAVEVWLTKLEKHLESASGIEHRKLLDRPQPDPRRGRLPGRPAAVAGRAAEGPLRPLPPPAGPVPGARHPDACCVVADFAQPAGRDGACSGRSCRWRRRPSGRPGSTCGSPWSSAGRTPSAPASTRPSALVGQCGEPNVGVCLDVFHYYKGPSKPEDLAGLTPREPGLRAVLRRGRRAARADDRRRPRPARRRRLPVRRRSSRR